MLRLPAIPVVKQHLLLRCYNIRHSLKIRPTQPLVLSQKSRSRALKIRFGKKYAENIGAVTKKLIRQCRTLKLCTQNPCSNEFVFVIAYTRVTVTSRNPFCFGFGSSSCIKPTQESWFPMDSRRCGNGD